jgi:hypothetical protein
MSLLSMPFPAVSCYLVTLSLSNFQRPILEPRQRVFLCQCKGQSFTAV